jgi:hypothetical protein
MSTTEQKTDKSTNIVKKSQAKVSIIDTDMDDGKSNIEYRYENISD